MSYPAINEKEPKEYFIFFLPVFENKWYVDNEIRYFFSKYSDPYEIEVNSTEIDRESLTIYNRQQVPLSEGKISIRDYELRYKFNTRLVHFDISEELDFIKGTLLQKKDEVNKLSELANRQENEKGLSDHVTKYLNQVQDTYSEISKIQEGLNNNQILIFELLFSLLEIELENCTDVLDTLEFFWKEDTANEHFESIKILDLVVHQRMEIVLQLAYEKHNEYNNRRINILKEEDKIAPNDVDSLSSEEIEELIKSVDRFLNVTEDNFTHTPSEDEMVKMYIHGTLYRHELRDMCERDQNIQFFQRATEYLDNGQLIDFLRFHYREYGYESLEWLNYVLKKTSEITELVPEITPVKARELKNEILKWVDHERENLELFSLVENMPEPQEKGLEISPEERSKLVSLLKKVGFLSSEYYSNLTEESQQSLLDKIFSGHKSKKKPTLKEQMILLDKIGLLRTSNFRHETNKDKSKIISQLIARDLDNIKKSLTNLDKDNKGNSKYNPYNDKQATERVESFLSKLTISEG